MNLLSSYEKLWGKLTEQLFIFLYKSLSDFPNKFKNIYEPLKGYS